MVLAFPQAALEVLALFTFMLELCSSVIISFIYLVIYLFINRFFVLLHIVPGLALFLCSSWGYCAFQFHAGTPEHVFHWRRFTNCCCHLGRLRFVVAWWISGENVAHLNTLIQMLGFCSLWSMGAAGWLLGWLLWLVCWSLRPHSVLTHTPVHFLGWSLQGWSIFSIQIPFSFDPDKHRKTTEKAWEHHRKTMYV